MGGYPTPLAGTAARKTRPGREKPADYDAPMTDIVREEEGKHDDDPRLI